MLDWTQTDLAEACGLAPNTIKNYEKADGPKTVGATAAIRAAFERNGVRFEISDTEVIVAQRIDMTGRSSGRSK